MGHDVLHCGKCGQPVMEGHNTWECDNCGAFCGSLTEFTWVDFKDQVAKYIESIGFSFVDHGGYSLDTSIHNSPEIVVSWLTRFNPYCQDVYVQIRRWDEDFCKEHERFLLDHRKDWKAIILGLKIAIEGEIDFNRCIRVFSCSKEG